MKQWENISEVLDFAIANEVKATFFYEDLARKVENSNLQELFRSFAKEEEGHAAKLRRVKAGARELHSFQDIPDLKIADYLVANDSDENLDYQGALVLAMKREKSAFRLYTDLANASGDPAMKELFGGLAQEEAKHKLRFELEYDQYVLGDN